MKKSKKVVAVISLLFMVLIMTGCKAMEPAMDEKDRQKIASCNSRTTDYTKCSWSAWEQRCVCKQR